MQFASQQHCQPLGACCDVDAQQHPRPTESDSVFSVRSPDDSVVKNLPDSARDEGDVCSIPRSGRSTEIGNGNPLQFSCLENSMDRGAGQATVHGVAKS